MANVSDALARWCDELTAQPADSASAAGAVEQILDLAVAAGASDMHLEPSADRMTIRLRIDGVLQPAGEIAGPVSGRIISRLKVLAGLLSYRHDLPQEGQIDANEAANRPEMRLAVFPTIAGERAMVRLFSRNGAIQRLNQLGLTGEQENVLSRLAGASDGMVLLTGPAGSGKTTTIYALLRHLVQRWPGRSILTLEDPVEQVIAGASQSQVGGPGGMSFADGLRSALRQDPQVLIVGEIRDGLTAKTAIEAALTGHLLVSTIHAGSAAAVFARLLQIGVEPFQVASSVTAVQAQRLPRRLCPACRGGGCGECRGTGFAGRAMLAELLVVGETTRQAIMARASLAELESAARKDGLTPLAETGRRMADQAVTTAEELARVGVH